MLKASIFIDELISRNHAHKQEKQTKELAAGRYFGKSLPDLYRTPQALQSVFGPIGPALLSDWFPAMNWSSLSSFSASPG